MEQHLHLHLYQNHDRRCHMAATSQADYCWSYAHHVDGTAGYEDMLPICRGCDQWTEFLPVSRSSLTPSPPV